MTPTRNATSTRPTELKVFDGTRTSTGSSTQKLVSIRSTAPEDTEFVNQFESYDSLFKNAASFDCGGFTYQTELRQKKSAKVVEMDGHQHMLVDVPPDPQAGSMAIYGWRLLLDPDKGRMPKRIDVIGQSTPNELMKTIEIKEFEKLPSGEWVPVNAVIESFTRGIVYMRSCFDIDVRHSQRQTDLVRQDGLHSCPLFVGQRPQTDQRPSSFRWIANTVTSPRS